MYDYKKEIQKAINSEASALRVKEFIETGLKHTIGEYAGKPFILQDWQWGKIILPLYGTLNPDMTRQYRTCLVEVGRKNGKTTLAAALALYHLFSDHEMGGQIYSAATDKDQASLVFNEAASMVRSNPKLLRKCKIIDSQKRIVNYRMNSFYRAISADTASAYGFNPSCIIYDELHAAANRELFDVLSTSTGARRQPLLFIISTAGYDRNSILYEQYNYAKKILKGIVKDKTFLPVIYETNKKDNWENEKNWYKANPALGTFRGLDEMRSLYNKAKETPALQNIFRRLYLNQWTRQETRWMEITKWDESDGKVEPEELKGKVCYGGLDLSSTMDISAFVLVFPIDGILKVIPLFFIPANNIEARVKKDRVPYDEWVRQGFIIATPGNIIDYQFIEDTIDKYAKQFEIEEVAYDPWNATMLTQRLAEKGMTMVEVHQGFASMSAPTKQLETLILQKKIHHGGNPVMRWFFDNVMVKQDAQGNLKPDREKSKEKIDGIVGLILAVSRAMVNENRPAGRGAILI